MVSGFLLLALSSTNNVLAYNDKTTHPDLTREVIIFYELSTGKKFTEEQKQWIVQGSIDEDFAPRWLNHFYDPVYERGLSTDIPGINGYLARNWAQFSSYQTINIGNIFNLWTGNGPVISGSEWGDFSYEAAIKNYSQNKEKEAYLALGHLLHLIEDMTVPEHTRNDPHPGGNDLSFYENWTMSNSSGLTQDLGKRLFDKGYRPTIYGSLEAYFNNLTIYTNNIFFSPDTIKSEIYLKPKIIFEDGTFAYGLDENGQYFDLAIITTDKLLVKSYSLNNPQILLEYWLRLSRQAVINGAGIINLFLNQAEAARQVELAKQKVEAQQAAQKSSFFGSIINLFKNPGENNQPALIITSEPAPAKPKINQIQPKPSAQNSEPKPAVPQAINPAPTPVPPVPAPIKTSPPATQNTLSQQNSQTTQQPQTNAPIVYGGGGGGGSSSSNTQQTSQNQNAATSSESLSVQTFNVGDLVINEIMYDLGGDLGDTDTNREWIELYNNSSFEIDLTGWKFNDGDDTTNHGLNVPPDHGGQGSMILPVGGYLILAEHAETFLIDHSGFSGTVIDTAEMNLKNASSTVTILKVIASDGTVIDEVTYYNSWGANGDGKTLERKSAAGGSNDPNNWAESSAPGGTPGAANNWELSILRIDSSASTTPEMGLGTDVAATTTITGNTTWTLAGSPYRLFFDGQRRPTVAAGAVLTIEPGVKIIPQGGGYTALEIQGTLQAIATSGAPIIFTSIKDGDGLASTTPQSGDWLNIAFSEGSQGNLDYVEFRYGGQGLERPVKEMVKIIGATVNINHSTFTNSQSIALRLVDSNGVVENSTFSDNACGISVDSLVLPSSGTDGGCASNVYSFYSNAAATTTPQIKTNQFIRNRLIAIETRNGSTPVIDNNIFSDNGYPVTIDSSYPTITNSQIANSTPSTSLDSELDSRSSGQATSTFFEGISISGHTRFTQNFTLKKDLPYILETNGPALSPYIDFGATLTIEPGTIFKTDNTSSALFIYGSLIASTTLDNPVVFTSLKDDSRGGDTNGDGSASSPQDNDWANIKFFSGSIGNFTNTIFSYGGYGYIALPPTPVVNQNTWIGDQNCHIDYCDSVLQQFTAGSNSAGETTFTINAGTANGTSTISVDLYSDNNDVRGALISNLGVVDLRNYVEEKTISITANFSAGTKYWISLSKISGATNSIYYRKNQNNYGVQGQLKNNVFTDYRPDGLYLIIRSNYNSNPNAPALSVDTGATVVVQ